MGLTAFSSLSVFCYSHFVFPSDGRMEEGPDWSRQTGHIDLFSLAFSFLGASYFPCLFKCATGMCMFQHGRASTFPMSDRLVKFSVAA